MVRYAVALDSHIHHMEAMLELPQYSDPMPIQSTKFAPICLCHSEPTNHPYHQALADFLFQTHRYAIADYLNRLELIDYQNAADFLLHPHLSMTLVSSVSSIMADPLDYNGRYYIVKTKFGLSHLHLLREKATLIIQRVLAGRHPPW